MGLQTGPQENALNLMLCQGALERRAAILPLRFTHGPQYVYYKEKLERLEALESEVERDILQFCKT